MEDADLEEAATLAALGSYKNSASGAPPSSACWSRRPWQSGSSSCCWKKTRAIKYGDPMDPNTDMGTVIDERRRARSRLK